MTDRELLKEVITDQRLTMLGKDPGVRRGVMKRVSEVVHLPHVIVISGIRRCGKSTLLRQIINEHYNEDDFFYLNFEDERLRDFGSNDFNDLYEAQLSLYGKRSVFMIDEIQNVDGFETFIRRFQEQGMKFFITGSNANLLSRELGTKLTGRYLRIDLGPFSFTEMLDLNGIPHSEETMYQTESKVILENCFDDYLENGGMPEYLKFKDQEILLRIYEDIVLKDIVVRYGLESTRMVRDLYGYLISNLTNRFSYNSLRRTIGAGSTVTIQNWVHYLEEANFCNILEKYDRRIRKQIVSQKKFYLADHGFLRPVSTRLTRDHGKVLENVVFNHLKRNGDIFYFEGGNECDLIIVKGNEVVGAYQVTYELAKENRKRETEGLLDAMNEFGLCEGWIVTHHQEEEIDIDGMNIHVIPAWKWCMRMETGIV